MDSLGAIMASVQDDPEGALRKVDALLSRQPENEQALFGRALVLAQLGRDDEATVALDALVIARPSFQPAWYNLGVLRQRRGDPGGAIGAYEQSLNLKVDDLPTLLNLGAACLDASRLDEGLAHFARACQVNPGSPKAHLGYAMALGRNGRGAEGIEHLHSLLQQAPQLGDAWYQLGSLQLAAGRHDLAAEALERAAKLEPGNLSASLELARAYQALQRFPDAVSLYAGLAQRHPKDGRIFAAWAAGSEQQGLQAEADGHIDHAVRLAPANARVLFQCGAVLSGRTAKADLERAESLVERAVKLEPALPNALDCLALLLSKKQQWDRSVALSRQAVSLAPHSPDFALTLEASLRGAGELAEAQAALRSALKHHPEHSELHRQLGLALLAEQAPEDALSHLDHCLRGTPVDQRAIAHRAVALQHLGRHEEADSYTGIHRQVTEQTLAVPDGFGSLEAFNRAFADDIRKHSRLRWEPVGLAARHGALTDELLADRTPAILGFAASHKKAVAALIDRLQGQAGHPFLGQIPRQYHINYWATLVEEGGNIDTHIHEESWLSGAYYVELPGSMGPEQDNPDGWIEFGRPHQDMPLAEGTSLRLLQPAEGKLLLFPSYLFHRTLPFDGRGQRISVSFDLVPE